MYSTVQYKEEKDDHQVQYSTIRKRRTTRYSTIQYKKEKEDQQVIYSTAQYSTEHKGEGERLDTI